MSEASICVPYVDADTCTAVKDGPWGYYCTRAPGHGGRHAAGYPTAGLHGPWKVVAVWGEDEYAAARERGHARQAAAIRQSIEDELTHLRGVAARAES